MLSWKRCHRIQPPRSVQEVELKPTGRRAVTTSSCAELEFGTQAPSLWLQQPHLLTPSLHISQDSPRWRFGHISAVSLINAWAAAENCWCMEAIHSRSHKQSPWASVYAVSCEQVRFQTAGTFESSGYRKKFRVPFTFQRRDLVWSFDLCSLNTHTGIS